MTTIPNLISLNDACTLTSLSRTAINNFRSEGKFPEAVALSDRRIAFVRSEVVAWIDGRIAARAQKAVSR
ncbi:AlpA family phage regulatory protein [Pseudochrobactrum algeriensis]|uniref:helix-turn-helix transcriptional regulator n=1 Tax=Pseudochrobactrum algeriensis TaxID=2834768 RepID=UPI001BD12CEF|nr:AlpA family phage regulatory protein [Pseudochrobactrum algeriensis]QVQ38171.1 AlpA family phage regulatory protein [Pseudochrobactrum algeriensis]QVQ41397.1 AlpA family phage regulatory protein [Pseudochrobactrum algeriensis]QVQ45319.1 AlpA family phage regulatory protein [Pseudochrobactrum algeriensis]